VQIKARRVCKEWVARQTICTGRHVAIREEGRHIAPHVVIVHRRGHTPDRIDATARIAGRVTDEDGVGYGLVGKAGVRAFINDNLYVGLFGKLFTNNQDTDRLYVASSGNHTVGETMNLGGYVICGEIGFRF
jgi:hypothetical protein